MAAQAVILPEMNFLPIFEQYPVHFLNEIRSRGWGFLLHAGNVDGNGNIVRDYYIEDLVRQFYQRIDVVGPGQINVLWENPNPDWEEDEEDAMIIREITVEHLAEIIGIPSHWHAHLELPMIEYMLMMGRSCNAGSDRGLKASTTYQNVYVTGRWILQNILGSSKTSSFFVPSLKIIHSLMTGNRNYCIVRQLIDAIGFSHTRQVANLVLPCIVTKICKALMTEEEFSMFDDQRVELRDAPFSKSYQANVHEDWIPEMLQEHVPPPVSDDDIDDVTFFRQDTPSPSKEGMSRLWGGIKRIFKKLDQIGESLGCSSSTTGLEPGQRGRGRGRGRGRRG